jgi:hypothetical protein
VFAFDTSGNFTEESTINSAVSQSLRVQSVIAPPEQLNLSTELSFPGRDLIPARFVRMPESGSTAVAGVDPAFSSDYLPSVRAASKNRTFRFSRMPIPVSIDLGAHPELLQDCLSALFLWEERSHRLVNFVQADPNLSRIQIRIHSPGTRPRGISEGAVTHLDWQSLKGAGFQYGNRFNQSSSQLDVVVKPQIIDVYLDAIADRDADMKPVLLRNILAHEIGHALGLLGHSPVQSDLLYRNTDEYSRLSERDLNTLFKLYRLGVDIAL